MFELKEESRPAGIEALLQPSGGVFRSITGARAWPGEPQFATRFVPLGDMDALSDIERTDAGHRSSSLLTGAGTASSDEHATLLALAEAMERYCSCLHHGRELIWASAQELGAEALDLSEVPKCSAIELAHPKCPLIAPSKKKPIRWVRGISLTDGRVVYLPAAMVYLKSGFACPAERFWFSISTGCAVHTSYERALVGALLEVVERDAISVVWLQKIPLPRIEIDAVSASLADSWERYQSASSDLEYAFFDATTDLRIPTVYGLQMSQHDKHAETLVSCATALDPGEAAAKVIRDMSALRHAFRHQRSTPENWDDYSDVFDGATYMAGRGRRSAFEFLRDTERIRKFSQMFHCVNGEADSPLESIIKRLQAAGLDAYAVDLTTDEAKRVGLRAVRVLVPGLQPLSFHHRARFLGTARLYEAPARMGYRTYSESELNAWPQPFA